MIADLFQRLDLMERRGSGFKKVIEAYDFESEKRSVQVGPEFRSTRTAFFVTLPNLNYGRLIGQVTGQVRGQVTGQVDGEVIGQVANAMPSGTDFKDVVLPANAVKLLRILTTEMTVQGMMKKLRLSSRAHLRKSALSPALNLGFIAMTQPDSPRSPTQKYRLTEKGRAFVGLGRSTRD